MAIQKTASGKVDKRTKEYKEMVERVKKARKAKEKKEKKSYHKEVNNQIKGETYS